MENKFSDEKIIDLSATALANYIRDGALTSEQVVRAFLKRIEEVNPKINAVVELNAKAIDDAKELDKYQKEHGTVKGPLHGVPITLKEQFAVKGFKQTQGGVFSLKDHVATEDTTIVARLKEAGVVILGTTNSPEMAMAYETTNHLYGRTNNAVNHDRSAGGSSGGEAAIVASKGSPLGIGSDIGGSVRVPAHYNGVSALKPSKGRVPMTKAYYMAPPFNFEDFSLSADMGTIGPLSRYVEDLELVLKVISGTDFVDSLCVLPPYENDLQKVDVSKLRIAYFFETKEWPVTPCTRAAIEKN